MTGWRTAIRIAWREARRARGRSALVIAMIAVPVAALSFAAVTSDTFTLTSGERATRLMGGADAVVVWPYDGPVHQNPGGLQYLPTGASTPPGRPDLDRLMALLPSGARAEGDQSGSLTVRTSTGIGTVRARMLDHGSPLARGILRTVTGRAPSSPAEAALTPAAAARLGTELGGSVRLADGSRTFQVVGIVEDPADLAVSTVLLRPGAMSSAAMSSTPRDVAWLIDTPQPLTWAQVKQLNGYGVVAVSRLVLEHPPSQAERYPEFDRDTQLELLGTTVLVAGLAVLEVVLLAGPAFAVGARRRQRDLALISAAGGTPRVLRRIVLADGVVLGAVAAAIGVALGIAVAAGTRTFIEEHLAHARAGALRVFPSALVVLAGVAVITGALAALVPAWISSRQDVVAALAGRRGITRSRRRWPVLGAVLVATGAAVAALGIGQVNPNDGKDVAQSWLVILGGLALIELGLILATPALVGLLTRASRWLPLAPRIALRDISRNRTAAAPAISAVMAAVVGSLAAGVVLTATAGRAAADYHPLGQVGDVVVHPAGKGMPDNARPVPLDAASSALRETMPVRDIYQVSLPSCDAADCVVEALLPASRNCPYSGRVLGRAPTPAEQVAARHDPMCAGIGATHQYFAGLVSSDAGISMIVDGNAAGAAAGLSHEDAELVAAAMGDGKVIVGDPRYLVDGQVSLAITTMEMVSPTRGEGRQTRTVTTPGFALPHPARAPVTMLTEATAHSLGLNAKPFVVIATTSRIPTTAEQDRLQEALGTEFGVAVERPAQPAGQRLLVLAIVAGVIAIGAAAIATGLAAVDARSDVSTLAAVGASPVVRRMLALSQSGVIAGVGSALGAAVGVGVAIAVLLGLNQRYAAVWPTPTEYPITVPWLNLAITLLVVPAVAMLGTGLLTRSRLPIERRS